MLSNGPDPEPVTRIEEVTPKITKPAPALNLEYIEVPTKDHVAALIAAMGMPESRAHPGLEVAIRLLRASARGKEEAKRQALKEVSDALSAWLAGF